MRKSFTYFLFSFSILLLTFGCKREKTGDGLIEAEHITYKVNYLERMAGDIPTALLPNEMHAYYTKRYILTRIHGYFDQFSLVQVADLRQNKVTSMLNFFGTKVYYTGEKGEGPAGISELEDPTMEITNDTLNICGMNSTRAVVRSGDQEYDVYFIKEIDIRSPNITTPYRFIDHVLSDFRVQLSVLKMHLVMFEHNKTEIDVSMFEVPEGYKMVSRASMESIINSLFTKE